MDSMNGHDSFNRTSNEHREEHHHASTSLLHSLIWCPSTLHPFFMYAYRSWETLNGVLNFPLGVEIPVWWYFFSFLLSLYPAFHLLSFNGQLLPSSTSIINDLHRRKIFLTCRTVSNFRPKEVENSYSLLRPCLGLDLVRQKYREENVILEKSKIIYGLVKVLRKREDEKSLL